MNPLDRITKLTEENRQLRRSIDELRERLAEMESLLESEKATRNAIIAKGQQAEARVKELEAACAELVTDGNAITLAANLARQSERVKELERARSVLAIHAAGEPEVQT